MEKHVFTEKSGSPPSSSGKKRKRPVLIAAAAAVLALAAGALLWQFAGPGFRRYEVTFDPCGGDEVDSVKVWAGRSLELPETARENYTLTGWTMSGEEVASPFTPEGDVTLCAEWLGNEYTVSFHTDGGDPAPEPVVLRTGDQLAWPESPSKEGYLFRSWTGADGADVPDGTVLPWGDTVLTASWEYEYYDLTFDTDGGGEVKAVSYHIGDTFPEASSSRNGYIFKGWADADGNEVAEGAPLPVGGMSVKAVWERKSFRVSFESNGGSRVSSVTVYGGDPFKYPAAPWKDGYRFVEWLDENGDPVRNGTVINSSMTVYAKWEVRPAQYTTEGYEIVQKNGITYIGGVMIANKTYPLPSTYAPGGLTSDCSSAFEKMKEAAAADGITLWIVSGYRSYSTQESIYWRYVRNDGMSEADTYSARPGHSEHQTGLAMDVNSLKSSFADTAEGKWLAEHCHEYGFIIRYPKGKQSITGYIYEPWHVRYLGVDLATSVYESGLCLEEYFGFTSSYQIASAYEQYGKTQ